MENLVDYNIHGTSVMAKTQELIYVEGVHRSFWFYNIIAFQHLQSVPN